MKCNECYWCAPNNALGKEMVCCNKESVNYNKLFSKEGLENYGCETDSEEELQRIGGIIDGMPIEEFEDMLFDCGLGTILPGTNS